MSLEPFVDGLMFPEAPRWHEGSLWFSDMQTGEVLRVGDDGVPERILKLDDDEYASGLGWLPGGDLLVVAMQSKRILRLAADGTLSTHVDLRLTPFKCNDMVVDSGGRAYVGNFGFDHYAGDKPAGTVLLRADPDGSVHQVADDLWFPNGMVITPDGKTLIVAETYGQRLTAFDIEADGALTGRRVWAQVPQGYPDGITMDQAGGIWVATASASSLLRVEEGGTVTDYLDLEKNAYACMLGGADGRTLHVLVAEHSNPAVLDGRRTGAIWRMPTAHARGGQP